MTVILALNRSWDSSIRAWRATDGLYLYTLEGHSGAVLALAQSLNGEVRHRRRTGIAPVVLRFEQSSLRRLVVQLLPHRVY